MSSSEFTEAASWGGRRVARRIADVDSRMRVVVTGTIIAMRTLNVGGSDSLSCEIDDTTGTMRVLFVGRDRVPGMHVGTRCTLEGTARGEKGDFSVWNPLYRLEPAELGQGIDHLLDQ